MRILWHRLLKNPTTSVESQSGDLTLLRVDGLMCDDVCAVRTRKALEALPGVTAVSVDLDTGMAHIVGTHHAPSAYEQTVTGAVALKPLRRLIERTANTLRREKPQAPESLQ